LIGFRRISSVYVNLQVVETRSYEYLFLNILFFSTSRFLM